jgi:hypothetical protein
VEFLCYHFLITKDHYPTLVINLQSIFHHFGEYVAGDEKVYHMTGARGDIRFVPSKKAVWLWMFQLTCCRQGGYPYVLWFRQSESDVATNMRTQCIQSRKNGLTSLKDVLILLSFTQL